MKLLAAAFSEIIEKNFGDAEVSSGAGGIKAICSRPEVDYDVTSDYNVGLFGTTMLRICELLASAIFQKIEISHLCNALTTVHPFGPHFQVKKQKCYDLQKSK